METRALSDGNRIPLLGLGVWQVANDDECVNAVRWALELGYRHIDTAQAYGNEEAVGEGLRRSGVPREEVFVTPEYNHSYPASLKNAIDYLHHEWRDKPVGFVSYGGVAAGTRAVAHLEPVVGALRMVPAVAQVNIPFHSQFIDDGRFVPNEVTEQAADGMLDELLRLHGALSTLRSASAA